MKDYNKIISNFNIDGEVSCASVYGDGHINDTYYISVNGKRYILQRINKNVFKNPPQIMSNIEKITRHLRQKIIAAGGNPERETLNIIYTKDGKSYHISPENDYYRMFAFIMGARTYQTVEKPIHFYNAAKAFGKFQVLLSDFPANELYEPIPNFHNTQVRYENLLKAISDDKAGRVKDVQAEIEFALNRHKDTDVLVNLINSGDIPLRVTHNDTKYNNIMIDDVTGEGVCIIDLILSCPALCFTILATASVSAPILRRRTKRICQRCIWIMCFLRRL